MGKTQRGARFATQEEFRSGLAAGQIEGMRFEGCGVPLMSTAEKMYVDNSEAHALGVGSTGAGKSTLGAIPAVHSMIACGESMIVTDLKGEIYQRTSGAAAKAGYKIIVLNFDRPSRSNRWNPLWLPFQIYHKGGFENQDEAAMLVYDIAYSICAMPAARDRFWDMSSINFTSGLMQGLIEDARPEEVNMRSIALMGNLINERFAGGSYLKEYFALKDPDSVAFMSASGTIDAPNETRGSIISVDRQAKRIFMASEGVSRMLSGMDFSYEDLVAQKTVVYLMYPGETCVYMPLVSCFVGQAYFALVRIAKQQPDLRLPRRCNFVLDEFSNLTVSEFSNRISMGRGYNLRFLLFIQDTAQLRRKYSDEDMQTILSNCMTKIYYNVENPELKQRLSNESGTVRRYSEKGYPETRPLLAPYELGMLRFGEAFALRREVNFPYVTNLTPCFRMALPEYDHPNPLPTLPDEAVSVFDLKEFVKEKKRVRSLEQAAKIPEGAPNPPAPPQPLSAPNMPAPLDAEKLSREIDARIAALEQEEKVRRAQAKDEFKESCEKKDTFAKIDGFMRRFFSREEGCDEDHEDVGEEPEFFGNYDCGIEDMRDSDCVFGNEDIVDLMKLDGVWDDQCESKASGFNALAATAFVADFEVGKRELEELFPFVLQLPAYADYSSVRQMVYDAVKVNENNLHRLLCYIEMHDDPDAYTVLLRRFNLTKAQRKSLLDRAEDAFTQETLEWLGEISDEQDDES